MAKKKTTRKGKKKTNGKLSALFQKTKQFIIGLSAAIVLFIAVMYTYDLFFSVKTEKKRPIETKEQVITSKAEPTSRKNSATTKPKKQTSTQSPPTSKRVEKVAAQVEIPQLKEKRKEQIIRHEGYTVSYNSDYKVANWVAYELTDMEVNNKKVERSNKFVSDPDVKGATATNEDYTRSGYDRGHLAPAADMKWSAKAMRESFYLSNICPQAPGLNRGVWNDLEAQCRMWAKDNGSLYIITGPIFGDDMKRLGKNRVAIPAGFYKVLCFYTGSQYKGIGFLFENRDYNEKFSKAMAVPIDKVEKATGIDFFPAIPDDEEKRMEKSIDWGSWSF